MRSLLAALAVVGVRAAAPTFDEWAAGYGFTFNSNEDKAVREAIYDARVAYIEKVNAEQSEFTLTWNQFAMYTMDEIVERFTGAVPPGVAANSSAIPFVSTKVQVQDVDWTASGYVSPVKNQGQCGSCWAFAATGAIEAGVAIVSNSPNNWPILSEEELVDCSGHGCDGGWPYLAFSWYANGNAACSSDSYPYTGTDSGACQPTCQAYNIAFYGTGYYEVPAGSESQLQLAVMQAPVTVAVNVDDNFSYYSTGILSGDCSANTINHAVLVVGYGPGFYKIKNSWGTAWGDAGYMKVASGTNAFCITLYPPSYPNVGVSTMLAQATLNSATMV